MICGEDQMFSHYSSLLHHVVPLRSNRMTLGQYHRDLLKENGLPKVRLFLIFEFQLASMGDVPNFLGIPNVHHHPLIPFVEDRARHYILYGHLFLGG